MRTDTERLEFIIENSMLKCQGRESSWFVLDVSDGLTFYTDRFPAYREAIDAAIERKEKECVEKSKVI